MVYFVITVSYPRQQFSSPQSDLEGLICGPAKDSFDILHLSHEKMFRVYGKAPSGLDESLSLNKVNWNVFSHCTKVGFEAYIVSRFVWACLGVFSRVWALGEDTLELQTGDCLDWASLTRTHIFCSSDVISCVSHPHRLRNPQVPVHTMRAFLEHGPSETKHIDDEILQYTDRSLTLTDPVCHILPMGSDNSDLTCDRVSRNGTRGSSIVQAVSSSPPRLLPFP